MMNEESPKNSQEDSTSLARCAKRVRFTEQDSRITRSSVETSTNQRPKKRVPPSEVAITVASGNLRVLLPSLYLLLIPYVKEFFSRYGSAFWKIRKQYEIKNDPSAIPTSAKVKFALNLASGVRESESARVLLAKKDDVILKVQKMLAGLAFEAFDLNVANFVKEKTKALCMLMERAASGILAQHNAVGYHKHQAVLDFIALKPDNIVRASGTKTL